MMIPALQDAANDLELVGPPLSIYLYLVYEVLDVVEYRPVKQIALATKLKVHENTIQRALNKLVESRYLQRGPVVPNEPRTYRIVYSRTAAA